MDLDDLIRAELAAQADQAPDPAAVLAGVAERGRARARHRALVAGAAAVAAAVAIAVPYALLRPADRPEPATPTAGPSVRVTDAEALRSCATRAPDVDGGDLPRTARLLARLDDDLGTMVWIGNDRIDVDNCAFDPAGRPTQNPGPGDRPDAHPKARGWLPAATPVRIDFSGQHSAPRPEPAGSRLVTLNAAGQVSRAARRVVVRWPGFPPATATLRGPYWVARTWKVLVPLPDPDPHIPGLTAYDAKGRVIAEVPGY